MEKEFFHETLKKYLAGKATEAEEQLIDQWYQRMGEEGSGNGFGDVGQQEKRYWSGIRRHIGRPPRGADRTLFRWYSVGLAASALLLLLSYLNIHYRAANVLFSGLDKKSDIIAFTKVDNNETKAKLIRLPDGSEVVLEPRSRIRYSAEFAGNERKVYLNGKAFFSVVHDEARPFKVVTREVITRVLGTSFTVSAFRWDQDVTVSVVTGKVSVYKKGEDRNENMDTEVILTPNQEFVFRKEERKAMKTLVKEPVAVVPIEEVRRMRFEDTSPAIVFDAIEKVYGVDIVFDEEKFSQCRITTNISDGNIFNRLLIICEVINANYRLEGTRIIIDGHGCHTN